MMALDLNIDLAILEFSQLQKLAEQKDIPNSCDLARPDLVATLRENGIGTYPPGSAPSQFPACGEKCLPSMVPCLEKLQDCIASLTRELAAVSATRDAELTSLRNDLLSTREKVNQLENVVGCGVLVQPCRTQKTMDLAGAAQCSHTSSLQSDKASTVKENGQLAKTPDVPRPYAQVLANGLMAETSSSASTADKDDVSFQPVVSRNQRRQARRMTRIQPHPTDIEEVGLPANKQAKEEAPQRNPIRRQVSSRYAKPNQNVPGSVPSLDAAPRSPRKVFYLGDIPFGCEAASIADWCRERGVEIVQCLIYSSEYFRTASARVTVEGKDADTVCRHTFWPNTMGHTVREWRFYSDQPTGQYLSQ